MGADRSRSARWADFDPSMVELTEQLFRREAGRLVAALSRIFGVQHLALAEDVVQDAFCRAIEVRNERGLPDNPSAWLIATFAVDT